MFQNFKVCQHNLKYDNQHNSNSISLSFILISVFVSVSVCLSAFLSVLYETHFQFYFCAPETQYLISLNLDFKGYTFS